MSVSMDNYPFECDACNYEGNFKSPQVYKIALRLHKKKCKKTGRTEKGAVLDEVARRMRDFQVANPNRATFLPHGQGASHLNQTGLDGEIAHIRVEQDAQELNITHINRLVALKAEIERQKVEAYADEEEGERGESPDECFACRDIPAGCDILRPMDVSVMKSWYGKKFMEWLKTQDVETRGIMLKVAQAKYEATGKSMDDSHTFGD